MNWKTLNYGDKFPEIPGVEFEQEYKDKALISLTIKINGSIIKCSKSGWGDTLAVAIPAPPEMVEKFKLTGKIGQSGSEIPFEQIYEKEYTAIDVQSSLSNSAWDMIIEKILMPQEK